MKIFLEILIFFNIVLLFFSKTRAGAPQREAIGLALFVYLAHQNIFPPSEEKGAMIKVRK